MRIIAIESGGPALGIAAVEVEGIDGPTITEEFLELDTALRHTESLVPSLERLMERLGWKPESVSAVLAGSGPGSFTGLRVGMAAAKGIALATGSPVVSVDTLEAYAESWSAALRPSDMEMSRHLVVPVIDARKGRYYAAFFMKDATSGNTSTLSRIGDNMDLDPETLVTRIQATLDREPGFAGWVQVGPAQALAEHSAGVKYSAAFTCGTAISGVVRLGLRALAAGQVDDDYKGPSYLRTGDVGEPRRYPHFSPEE